MTDGATRGAKPAGGILLRTGRFLVKLLAFFVILEPIWMLLPFAGFLYGSGLQIQTLARHPETAWLTHFVLPVLTLGIVGPLLVVAGLLVFLVGAGQIYVAKLRRKGLVTGGLYTFVRHPQYTALTLFAVGLLLAWGRAIMFLAFFVMMFLYYHLAKSEERRCLDLFGEEYEAYRRRVAFCIPGDRILAKLRAGLPSVPGPRALGVAVSFVLTLLVAFGLLWTITAIRVRVRTVPFLTATVPFSDRPAESGPPLSEGRTAGVPYVAGERILVVRGPWRDAAAPGFAEAVLRRTLRSPALADFLAFLEAPTREVAIVFCVPFTPPEGGPAAGERLRPRDPLRRGPEPDPDGPDRARLILLRCELAEGADITEVFADKSRRTILRGAIAWIDLSIAADADLVVKGPRTMGPPGSPMPAGLGEDRWDHLTAALAEREALAPKPETVPGRPIAAPAPGTELILVQAPILRTRIQPEGWFGGDAKGLRENLFAVDIRDRLAGSAAFRDRLERSGAGGDVVPVAFPRPGPNWYAEHRVRYRRAEDGTWEKERGIPQVSVFVMLVRRRPGSGGEALFDESRRGEREILGAFIAELDFGLDAAVDPVHEITTVGPRRDLEERWDFFLSGL
ncbi:MAG: isoprenylcysteine carboxylmethyltransferase family protein [Planctomycetota bacterium]